MKTLRNQNYWWKFEQLPLLLYLCKWLFLSVLSGACIGSASALLLVSLEWATQYREHHLWIIALLPVAGLLIGLMYHYWAGTAPANGVPNTEAKPALIPIATIRR
jgi:H+/Cl- antiporter ClcA